MSNYYHDEKPRYLAALAQVRAGDFDLTSFLLFGLKGITLQSRRMAEQIKHQVAKGLFRNLMYDLFHRLKSPRKRVIAERQIEVLKLLLEWESLELGELEARTSSVYSSLKSPRKALIRDLNELIGLGAIGVSRPEPGKFTIDLRLQWPTEITESKFFEQLNALPKAKTHGFLE
jgi:hypothetical protein